MLLFLTMVHFSRKYLKIQGLFVKNPHENDSLPLIQNLYSIPCGKRITQWQYRLKSLYCDPIISFP